MSAKMAFVFLFGSIITQALAAKVIAKGATSAVFGEEVSFSCSVSEPDGVSQVTWKKLLKDDTVENLATFSKRFGAKVMDPYVNRIDFTEASLNSTTIIIKNVTSADEACYICSFNVYPSGSTRKQTCLTVQGITEAGAWLSPTGEISSGVEVTCSGTGKPAPTVTWGSEVEITAVPREQRIVNADGTVTVNSTIRLDGFGGKSVHCLLSIPGTTIRIKKDLNLPKFVSPTVGGHSASGLWIVGLIVVIAVTAVVLAITLKLRRKTVNFRDYTRNATERLAKRCGCFEVSVEEEENMT
ncbi:hypothetical protein GJAV_G00253630 [Gymnothorax javanicus]|nr:hypothetical protein GJAV_G00253630 [Gymnothorax javanicus]